MRLLSHQPIWLLSVAVSPALAAFEDFQFAGNGGNSSATRLCPGMPFGCNPPNMCSQDTLTRKWYCCVPGADSVCWNGAPKCDGTGDGVPSGAQISCSSGTTKYCCLKDTERCTQVTRQINICWSTLNNPLQPLNASRLNDTFSSLSSARPSATAYAVERAEVLGFTSTTAAASSATSSASSTSSTSSPSSAPPADDGGLSGGAIGGIVGGVVGGLALLGVAGFFLWRRRRNSGKINPHAPPTDPYQAYGYQPGNVPQQPYSPQPSMSHMHEAPPPMDKYAHVHPQPVEAPAFTNPVEMDASYHHQQSHVPK